MKVVYVTKGSEKIGLGHVKRIQALREFFGFDSKVIFSGDKTIVTSYISDAEYISDLDLEMKYINQQKPDWIIFDRQQNSIEYIRKLKKENIKILLIEDNGPAREICDLLWDANINIKRKNFFTGFENAYINPSILKFKKQLLNKELEKIFICLGGTDVNKNIPEIISRLKNKYKLYILPGIHYNEYLKYNSADVTILNSNKSFCKIAVSCDVSIVSGGLSMYEMLSMNIPSIIWPQVKHQKDNAEPIYKKGYIDIVYNIEELVKKIDEYAENVNELKVFYEKMKKLEIGNTINKVKKILEDRR